MSGQSERPPAQPNYILRGHSTQIHAVHFFRHNSRLLTGDADGWVVLWSTTTKRGVAVWKAHKTTILGLGSWEDDKIITHGRDNRLQIWRLKPSDERDLTPTLPIDDPSPERRQPWLLHSLPVNALNFCAFSSLPVPSAPDRPALLIATPGLHDGHINLTSLPSETRVATIPGPPHTNTGMLMASGLHMPPSSSSSSSPSSSPSPLVLAGYESGHVCVWRRGPRPDAAWTAAYLRKPHSQPVLSLGVAAAAGWLFSSSADAVVARHALVSSDDGGGGGGGDGGSPRVLRTGHAGQQSLVVRSDEEVFATAGWDGRVRVYSVRAMGELAVLRWHREGCYAVGFARVAASAAATGGGGEGGGADGGTMVASSSAATTVSALRTRKAETTHWIAAGSKDGKVSLWEIY